MRIHFRFTAEGKNVGKTDGLLHVSPPKQIFLLFCNNFSFIINGGGAGKCEIATHGFLFFHQNNLSRHTHTHADIHTGKRQRHKINYNGNAIKKESGERESKGKEAKNWIDAQLPIQDYYPLFLFFVYVFFFSLERWSNFE
jgi:hypothetical protein